METNDVYLLLGGNLGDVVHTISEAVQMLGEQGEVGEVSNLYKTEAWGMANAPDFYNQVVSFHTQLSARECLTFVVDIEKRFGRERAETKRGYQNRTIDIDILLYNNEVINLSDLQVPHPRMADRRFVLKPLQELAADRKHPVLQVTIAQLLSDCKDSSEVKLV